MRRKRTQKGIQTKECTIGLDVTSKFCIGIVLGACSNGSVGSDGLNGVPRVWGKAAKSKLIRELAG